MSGVRIALSISGGSALGAYEGGAVAALLVAVQRLLSEPSPPVRIDVIAGSSAGAMTGLLATRTILEGYDPVAVFEEAWVRAPQIDGLLRKDGRYSPLSTDGIEAMARELLARGPIAAQPQMQRVALTMAITALRGLRWTLPGLDGDAGKAFEGTTYADWQSFEFASRDPVSAYTLPACASALDAAMASAANPWAFPPRLLDRSVDRLELARRRVVLDTPLLWYSDGGVIDNQPLGRALDLINRVEPTSPGESRLALVVHPRPGAPPPAGAWAGRALPGWSSARGRAGRVRHAQSIEDDLREVGSANDRIRKADELRAALAPRFAALSPEEQDAWRDSLPSIHGDAGDGTDRPVADVFDEVVRRVAHVERKRPVIVGVISPAVLLDGADGARAEDLLTGDFLAGFGGFLDEGFRRRDFDLGYRSTLVWLERHRLRWPTGGVTDAQIKMAIKAVRERYQPQPVTVLRRWPPLRIRHLKIMARLGARIVESTLRRAPRA